MSDLRDTLAADLRAAMHARDGRLVSLLRSTMSAIANAEAVDAASLPSGSSSSEVPRNELDAAAVRRVVVAEIDEMAAAADDLRAHGRTDDAAELDRRAAILRRYLG